MFPKLARLAIRIREMSCSSLIALLTGVEGRLEDGNPVVLCTQVWSALCCLFLFSSSSSLPFFIHSKGR